MGSSPVRAMCYSAHQRLLPQTDDNFIPKPYTDLLLKIQWQTWKHLLTKFCSLSVHSLFTWIGHFRYLPFSSEKQKKQQNKPMEKIIVITQKAFVGP